MLDGNSAPPPPKGRSPSQFSAHICCGQMAAWIKMPHGREVGLGPSDIVLDGDPVPLPKMGAEPLNFGPCLLWPNGCINQDAIWYGGRAHPRPHYARWGPSSPCPRKGAQPSNFRPMSIVPKTAGWIKMPLGMEIGLDPSDIVLDGDAVPLPQKGAEPSNFWPMSIVVKRLHGSRCHLVWR